MVLDSQVTSATARHVQNTGQWVVDVTLNSSATAAFAQLTTWWIPLLVILRI